MKTKMTRRHRTRGKNHRTRGGATLLMPNKIHPLTVMKTIMAYGLSSILIGPLYLLSEILNVPISNLNNLSRYSFSELQEAKHTFLHIPFYKMIMGCPNKEIKPEKFSLQDDMYIHSNLAVVSCNKNVPNNGAVKENSPSLSDSLLDLIGMVPNKRKLRHHVFRLFQYIDNLRETDEERKKTIQQQIKYITNYKTLIKCYLIYRTINCPNYNKNDKTVLVDEDIIRIVNPLYYPSSISYSDKVSCMWKHLRKDRFNKDDIAQCNADCESCTFNNSFQRMTKKYFSMASGSSSVSLVTSMLNTYFGFLTIIKDNVPLPKDSTDIIKYLNSIKVTSNLKDKLEENEKDIVLKKFTSFLCKYDIIPSVEEQIRKRIQIQLSKGYSMDQILNFI
jgi:hypothetical protein